MLCLRENMVVIDGQIRTSQIASCTINDSGDRYNVAFNNSPNRIFSYGRNRALWLKNPVIFEPQHCHIYHNGLLLSPLSFIAVFQQGCKKYWYIEYSNGAYANYLGEEINFVKSCLEDQEAKSVFEYLSSVAAINPLKSEKDDTPLLLRQYQNIDFIDNDRAAALFLNPKEFQIKKFAASPKIYPFSCNASQQKAVKAAFENQISIIQGPPGTGKTQTILNIVANIILQGKTVMVVSNNNSAIVNIVEKMDYYNMGFITAMLGSKENKEAFISAQDTIKVIPDDIEQWHSIEADKAEYLSDIDTLSKDLEDIFAKQERLALARQELDALKVEQTHFEQEIVLNKSICIRKNISSTQLIKLWCDLQEFAQRERYSGIFAGIINAIRDYRYKCKICRIFKEIDHKFRLEDIVSYIHIVQYNFYLVKYAELVSEIESLELFLSSCNSSVIMERLKENSMCLLRNSLYYKYAQEHKRPIFTMQSLDEEVIKEYPVILSTTFSALTNFNNKAVFDYVIMDEASQISSETGVLALTCAYNAVIVGDSMQLPNVITEEDKLRLLAIAMQCNIDEGYDCAHNSFLQSVCRVIPDVPQTLLREHYRCHPKIINFCNQKFYGGKLIIMTKDNGEKDVISAKRTVRGNHSRGKMNQREVEVINREVLPFIQYAGDEDIGIISPYNAQVDLLDSLVDFRIDVATVHKFQGREKDAIVMSTVDDIITEFSDNPHLLNVAISRAKQNFCLVVSGNEQPTNTNISDLLAYIEYNNCTITNSNIHSIFDLLYDQYKDVRLTYLKEHKRISEYDSENLTFALLEQIIEENIEFCHLGIICHYPLRQLLHNVSLLSEEDQVYALNPRTHIDFLIYNKVSKKPVLAIEIDGYQHHKAGTTQFVRDQKKNRILTTYSITLLRLSTTGNNERQKIESALKQKISNIVL